MGEMVIPKMNLERHVAEFRRSRHSQTGTKRRTMDGGTSWVSEVLDLWGPDNY